MKIVVSLASCANNNERIVLRSFYHGIEQYYCKLHQVVGSKALRKHNIELGLCYDPVIPVCDYGVQFGAAKNRDNAHHQARQSLLTNAKHIVYIETPILGRTITKGNLYPYYRVGLDGFLNAQGTFVTEIDSFRLMEQREALNLSDFPGWCDRPKGHILLLTQLPGDASLRGQDMSQWIMDTIAAIRAKSQSTIMVRLHPALSHKGQAELLASLGPVLLENHINVLWNDGVKRTLQQDLNDARVCVTYTSGASVDAVLAGVPVIAMDQGCLAYPISGHWIEQIDSPPQATVPRVRAWLDQLANSQWNVLEMREGLPWAQIAAMTTEEDSS